MEKKKSKAEILKLHKETLLRLQSPELLQVAGRGNSVSVCEFTLTACCYQQ